VLGGIEIRQVSEEEPRRVAQSTVSLDQMGQDLFRDPHIAPIVLCGDPKPKYICTVILDDGFRGKNVAYGLRHLSALPVEDEAMGQTRAIRRVPAGRDSRQE
jgi:hypothetical protein